jgi:hypothetical protein
LVVPAVKIPCRPPSSKKPLARLPVAMESDGDLPLVAWRRWWLERKIHDRIRRC